MKKLIWIIAPTLLVVIGILWLFNSTGGKYPLPKMLDSNEKGLLLSLPVVATEHEFAWQPAWVAASDPGLQAVKEALGVLVGQRGAELNVTVYANTGLDTREQYAERVGKVLAEFGLGNFKLREPDAKQTKVGVVMKSPVSESAMAQQLLGALSPFLGGRVALMYTELPAGEMELEFWGTPFFNSQGQATFDPNLINMDE